MDHLPVVDAFRAEAGQLAQVMLTVTGPDWSRPTPCPPWDAADLLAHVLTTIDRLPALLDATPPERAEVSAIEYYRADHRFSAEANTERVEVARQRAESLPDGHALAMSFDRSWRQIAERCASEPADRLVRTRHGDAMRLSDFLLTRVLELGVHGLDLATALDRPPWLTRPAAGLLTAMILTGSTATVAPSLANAAPTDSAPGGLPGTGQASVITGITDGSWPVAADPGSDDLGWDEITLLRKATGREPLTAMEICDVERHGITWLAVS